MNKDIKEIKVSAEEEYKSVVIHFKNLQDNNFDKLSKEAKSYYDNIKRWIDEHSLST